MHDCAKVKSCDKHLKLIHWKAFGIVRSRKRVCVNAKNAATILLLIVCMHCVAICSLIAFAGARLRVRISGDISFYVYAYIALHIFRCYYYSFTE